MKITCFYCNKETDLPIHFEAKTFACPSCGRIYIQNDGEFRFRDKFSQNYEHHGLELGSTGIINGKEFRISGILVKKAFGSFIWKEYILHNEALEFVFLSEADGHWILLEEIEDKFDIAKHSRIMEYEGMNLNLYEYYNAQIVSALGYFDFDVSKKTVHTVEYINPPYLISIEKTDGVEATFYGKHMSKSEVKKAFKVTDLPYKKGIGLVQPFLFNLKVLAVTFCIVALLIILSNWQLNKDRVEQMVLDTSVPINEYTNRDFLTPSFELKGSAAPLSITLFSDVNNSWANLQLTLVNEKTGEEIYANKDIEYYHGYTDGENWTEGSTSEEFNICGVAAGKYHLTLTPMKAPEDMANNVIFIKATWSKPSGRNVWLICIFMAVVLAVLFYFNRYFETKRWEDSSYSPYNNQ